MDPLTTLLNTYVNAKNNEQPSALNALLSAIITAVNNNTAACSTWSDQLSATKHEILMRKNHGA